VKDVEKDATTTKPLAMSTAHLLLPLIEEFGDRVDVWFFRSPNLKGLLEKIVPERYDEGWGTWHGKWYAVDDEVILSGQVTSDCHLGEVDADSTGQI
jgi:CDP-diacylglycerol--glycerol-3-phosphate 3-phosphatidyltransferase